MKTKKYFGVDSCEDPARVKQPNTTSAKRTDFPAHRVRQMAFGFLQISRLRLENRENSKPALDSVDAQNARTRQAAMHLNGQM